VNGPAILLDTSALLAPLLDEPGGEVVLAALAAPDPALMSAANLVEAIAMLGIRRGLLAAEARADILSLGIEILPFREAEAEGAGALLGRYRGRLSLGDCACLATARARGVPVLTGDRRWAGLELGVELRMIR
jgi:PIN domain nuclease of toxin-antitoxin system